jgi:hypothetical protein
MTPQRRRFAVIGRLAIEAHRILRQSPDLALPDLAEDSKRLAAVNSLPYFDAWPGAASPIQQAITIALERRRGIR